MINYQGGKSRLGKHIYGAILDVEKEFNKTSEPLPYFEPFCGMLGVMRHFAKDEGSNRSLSACDKNDDLVQMLRAVQRGWQPPKTCSAEEFHKLKYSKRSSFKRTFIGFACSYSGMFFSGFRGKYWDNPNYPLENANRNVKAFRAILQKVTFCKKGQSYDSFKPKGKLIYCDPPYVNNDLGQSNKFFYFDDEPFWNTMREWSQTNIVLISNSSAPSDFKRIFTKERRHGKKGDRSFEENLYVYKGQNPID